MTFDRKISSSDLKLTCPLNQRDKFSLNLQQFVTFVTVRT